MKKNRFILLFIISSMVLNFTSFYVIVNTLRALYQRDILIDPINSYTVYMKLLDTLNNRLSQIPILFYISAGIAIGMLIMILWSWLGFEENK